ncbi:MAG: hypothetical protein ACP5NX_00775 [Candidatus Bilamarchaeaceae archaeon]
MKGQAAIEYISTYGWAIMLLVLVIAAIIGSGFLNLGSLIPDECSIDPSMPCTFQIINKDSATSLNMDIQNSLPYKITITEVSVAGAQDFQADCELQSGERMSTGCGIVKIEDLQGTYISGQMKRIPVTLEFYSCAKEINPECTDPSGTNEDLIHTKSGYVSGRVLQG